MAKYVKMTEAEKAAAYANRFNPQRIEKEKNFKKLIDRIFRTQNWDSFRSNVRGAGGIIPLQYITEFNKAIEAGPDSKEFKDLLRFTGRTKAEILKLDELRPKGTVPIDVRAKAAAESFPEDRKLTPEKAKAKEQKTKLKRSKRLDTTVGAKAKFLSGTDAFPFHHIMPIGGEAQLTTNDVAVISKKMNSKLAPYNTKLNDIADAITTNFNNQPEDYLKKIEQLNNNAEQIVAKATKELPKKFQPYIGFTRLDPIFDEYGTPINIQETRVGAVKEKGIPLRDLSNEQLTKLKSSIKSLSEKEKIGYCSLLSRGGLPGDCAAAIDNDPVKAAQIFDEAPATSTAMAKVKNAAKGFLQSPLLRGAGKFGALAAVGAAATGAVKKFMNDDPTTYLSNEEQQKNMLIDMVTGSLDDTPQERPAILDYQLPVLGAGAVAGTAAVAPSTIEAARKGALGANKSGITKTALKTLGRGLTALGTPAALLATEPLYIAGQVQQGDSLAEIATNPANYLGAAFMGPATEFATKGLSPTIAKTMRLGISPSVLKTVSRRFGLPGLALSAGISGYELFDDYRNKRGMFSEE
jgi:hypothetical protein